MEFHSAGQPKLHLDLNELGRRYFPPLPFRQLGQDAALFLGVEARPGGDLGDGAEAAAAEAAGGVEDADGTAGRGRVGAAHDAFGGATTSASLVVSALALPGSSA